MNTLENLRKKMNGKIKVEDKIKSSRLEATMRAKREMEDKLKLLDEKLRILSHEERIGPSSLSQAKIEYTPKNKAEKNVPNEKEIKEEQKKKAEEFARKMIEQQKEIKKKNRVQIKQMEEKIIRDKEKEEMEKKHKEEEEEKIRKESLFKKIEESQAKRQENRSLTTKNAVESPLQKKEYLYEKLQKTYENQTQLSELERRKKIIAEKRNIYQPIKRTDFKQHEKHYEEVLKKYEDERKKEKIKATKEDPLYKKKIEQFKSAFSDDGLRSLQEAKTKLVESHANKKEKIAKMLSYAKAAQESYAPVISVSKANEVKNTIERLKKPKRKSVSSKKLKRERKRSVPSKDEENSEKEEELPNRSSVVKAKIPKKRANTIEKHQEEQPQKKKIDYLSELRNKGIIKRQPEPKATSYYEELIKSEALSPREKLVKVKDEVTKLEQQARKKEMMINSKASAGNFLDAENEVSDIYIKAIKAKLSLLKM